MYQSHPSRSHPSRSGVGWLARWVSATLGALALLVAFNTQASAGGWAVGSIDEMPVAIASETTDVGFTILQHGVTPVDLPDAGIEIVGRDGAVEFFPGRSDGVPGHHRATVTLPTTADQYSWNIRMGGFGVQDLGVIDVQPSTSSDASRASTWSMTRWALVGLTLVLGSVAVGDLASTVRRARMTPS